MLVVEAVGGVLTGSLALLSDAGHVLADVGALVLALVALGVASRPPTLRKSFGYHRFEVLAALGNGLTLWVLVAFLAWEAVRRLSEPVDVDVAGMLGVAGLGLVANVASAVLLARVQEAGLNLRAALLHVIGDLLGSVGTLVAGAVMWATGWTRADPIASLFICALILVSSWTLIRDTVNVLMEGTPREVDMDALQRAIAAEPGIRGV
ncbi:MAG TPA: cation diffusion facilitator family transporter, partial [Gemmatimonadota bacterium]